MSTPEQPPQQQPAPGAAPQAPPGYAQPPAAQPGGQLVPPAQQRANFGQRLGAYLIDVIILIVVGFVIQAIVGSGLLYSLISFIVGVAYFSLQEGSESGATVGKRALGIRVADFSSGGPIGYGRAVLRYLGRILSTIPIFLGYFWMLWDGERQTWHDKIATTVVIPSR